MDPEKIAAEIVRFVKENGRVRANADGSTDLDSLAVEVEYEARLRGYSKEETDYILAEVG